jgi:hypothetical protein
LQSHAPLFDEAKAVTPAAAGRYQEEENQYGRWAKKQTGTLSLDGRRYGWQADGDQETTFFNLYDVGGGFYIAAARPVPSDPFTYALFEASKDGFQVYLPTCADIMRMRQAKEDLPTVEGSDCFYGDREMLIRALKRYAAAMLPGSRYVPLKSTENK